MSIYGHALSGVATLALGLSERESPPEVLHDLMEVFREESEIASSYSCESALGEKGTSYLDSEQNLADHMAQARVVLRFLEVIIGLTQDDTPSKTFEELNLPAKAPTSECPIESIHGQQTPEPK
ncbi:hypothetical protein J1614_003823 [Plenodomus biglobosus]|nr:hypothetical protein J1614_003823 [Plenodomus biglobosus]